MVNVSDPAVFPADASSCSCAVLIVLVVGGDMASAIATCFLERDRPKAKAEAVGDCDLACQAARFSLAVIDCLFNIFKPGSCLIV